MEDLETIKRRVRKLLALSKSPNESEALSALRKANELMAEHRLTRADFTGYVKKSVKSIVAFALFAWIDRRLVAAMMAFEFSNVMSEYLRK